MPSSSVSSAKIEGESTNSHFLHAGQVHISQGAETIVMILGSCAAVCIWDSVHGIGGATHFLLPIWDGRGVAISVEAGIDKGQRVVFHPNTGASSVTTL